ncbi:MAG: sulfurtransferase [Micropruina sp.]|nr:sulfurtransferase [Micropruina sp.]HBX82024.1 sulfurtransferase [Propionibacteriaceae bacterium]
MIPPVVNRAWLAEHPESVLVDARSYFDGRRGLDAYRVGHLPQAVHVDVEDLSGAPTVAGGRHPFPTPEAFARVMSVAGIGNDSVVVAYDDAAGAIAARLVWMLRLVGTDAAILDGGVRRDDVLSEADAATRHAWFAPRPWPVEAFASLEETAELAAADAPVLDARPSDRYQGVPHPLDDRHGHMPGARSAAWVGNVDAQLRFRTPAELRERYAELGVTDADQAVAHCGSGVTACHDLLAMEYAGLGRGRLFVGSWSAYTATDRPVVTGPTPH